MINELEVPQASRDAMDSTPWRHTDDHIRAIATPVLVAYVRKLSEMAVEGPLSADDLNELANELERGVS